jgi:uncharacterized membrane protein
MMSSRSPLPDRSPGRPRSQRHPRSWSIPLLLALSGWLVLGITTMAGHSPIRPIAVFAFVLICPGLALVRLLPIRDFLERAVLAVALGLSLATLTAETADINDVLQPTHVLVVLAAICSGAALTELVRGM